MPDVIASDGVRIAYDVFGQRDGTPVLMIQGLGADARGWALQRARFGRRHRCIALDNRGVGRSDKPEGPYSLFQMAQDAIACLDAEGFETAHVMGASMGGVIAQIIATLHPERVTSLVLACTACQHHEWRRELLSDWATAVSENGMKAMSGDALTWLVGSRIQRRFGVLLNVLGRVVLQSDPGPFVSQVEAILEAPDEMRDQLVHVTAPTLIITGSQDALTPVGDAEELAELIAGSRLVVVSGAAHGVMAEAPNAFNDTVLRFLDEIDQINRGQVAASA